jgi:hypothetical protein
VPDFPQKKAGDETSPPPTLPLRHIGTIVIWEGNYRPDILIIGDKGRFLKFFIHRKEKKVRKIRRTPVRYDLEEPCVHKMQGILCGLRLQ